jgi:hypothetical protein
MVKLLKILPSKKPSKKFDAYFMLDNNKETIVSFGQSEARDFTLINDKNSRFYLPKKADRDAVKAAYRRRHEKDLKTNDPTRAGYLSYFLLWNKPTLDGSISQYKKNLK